MEPFNYRIKKERLKRGLSMQQFATMLRVSKNQINMWENVGSIPHPKLLVEISEKLNVTTDYLLGKKEK